MADTFLTKVVHMLGSDNEELIHWNNSGDSIVIVDANRFARELLPKYFKTKKFNSFVRQLNFYGFRKVPTSKTTKGCEFAHRLFKRGNEEKIMTIKRKTIHEMDTDQFEYMMEDQQQEEETYLPPEPVEQLDEKDKQIMLLKERCSNLEKENEELKRIANQFCIGECENDSNYFFSNGTNNANSYEIEHSNILSDIYGNNQFDDLDLNLF